MLQDGPNSVIGPLLQRGPTQRLPAVVVVAVHQGGYPIIAYVTQRVRRFHELSVGPNLVDQIKGQRLLAYLQIAEVAFEPADELITEGD